MKFSKAVKSSLKWKNTNFLSIVVCVGLCLGFVSVKAQEIMPDTVKQEGKIYDTVEVLPEFPGGESGRIQFLSENLKYPIEASYQNIEGRVLIGFVVEPDGTLSNFKVRKSAHPILDEEAMRVAKLMPNWKPGKQDGESVRVKYTMPITFRLYNYVKPPKTKQKQKRKP